MPIRKWSIIHSIQDSSSCIYNQNDRELENSQSGVTYEICTYVKLNDIDSGAESLDEGEVEDDDEVDYDGRDRGGDLEDEEGGE